MRAWLRIIAAAKTALYFLLSQFRRNVAQLIFIIIHGIGFGRETATARVAHLYF
jgi:hypothetical protein